MAVGLADFLEEPEIHEVYLRRYRAEYVSHFLWKIVHGVSGWTRLPAGSEMWHEAQEGGGGYVGTAQNGARLALITVPACFALGMDAQRLILGASTLERLLATMPLDERSAFEDFLNQRRHSAIFQLVKKHAMVRRNPNASRELASAAMRLEAICEVLS